MMARQKNVNQARRSQHPAATKMEGAQPLASADQGKLARTVATAALLHALAHLSLMLKINARENVSVQHPPRDAHALRDRRRKLIAPLRAIVSGRL